MKITTQSLINDADLKSLCFGIRAEEESFNKQIVLPPDTPLEGYPAISWSDGCSVAETQTLPSCDSNATANLLENQIWRTHGIHVTIDADKLYRETLAQYNRQTTLRLGQTLCALLRLKLLDGGCLLHNLAQNFMSVYFELKHGPIVVAHNISEDWRPHNLTPEGIVQDTHKAIKGTGHATLLVSFSYFNEQPYFIVQNSWGSFEPMGGLQALSMKRFFNDMIYMPTFVRFSEGWKNNRVWENYVI